MSAFDLYFDNVIKKWEGGTGERPANEDTGGLTVHGVTIGYWLNGANKIVNKPATRAGLLSLTWDEAKKISKIDFWDKRKINTILNPALRPFVSDAYWLGGGLASLGFSSISALNRSIFTTPTDLYNARMKYLRSLKNWEYNKNGWTNRINDVLKTAKKINLKTMVIGGGVLTSLIVGTILIKKNYGTKQFN